MSHAIFSAKASKAGVRKVPHEIKKGAPTNCGLRVARWEEWEGRSVYNPQPFHTNDPRPVVYNSVRIVHITHRTRTSGMVDGVETLSNNVFDLRIRLDLQAGESLLSNGERLHRWRLPESAYPLEACDCDLYVTRSVNQFGLITADTVVSADAMVRLPRDCGSQIAPASEA